MKGTIYINGVIGEDTNLLNVIRQIKGFKNLTEVDVIISSVGGNVDVGLSIYSYLRNLQLPITTIAKQAYSIAASIFMAGDNRIVEAGENRLMVHFPWIEVAGGSDYLKSVSDELKAIENDFIKFYSEYTSIDKDSIKSLLQNETFLSADEALDMGLATQIKQPLKAVAFYKKEEEKEMTKTDKFIKAMTDFFTSNDVEDEIIVAENETEINALVIQDATGNEINFPDVKEGEEPAIGDKAIDSEDKPITGERVMTDGAKWVFENGEVMEIIPTESEEETLEEEIDFDALLKEFETKLSASITAKFSEENKELKEQISAMKKLIGSEEIEVKASNKSNNNIKNDLPKGVQALINIRK